MSIVERLAEQAFPHAGDIDAHAFGDQYDRLRMQLGTRFDRR